MTLVPLAAIREHARAAGYPKDKRHLIERLQREGARRFEGVAARGQRGFLWDVESLPPAIRVELSTSPIAAPDRLSSDRYDLVSHSQKDQAKRRVLMMLRFKQLRDSGCPTVQARVTVAAEFNCCEATIKQLWKLVRNAVESDW